MKKETVEKMKTEALIKKLSDIDTKYCDAVSNHSSTKLGFGYAMRGYSRLKHMSFRATDSLKENARLIKAELAKRDCPPHQYHTTFV